MVGAIEIPLMGRLKAQTTRTKTSVLAIFLEYQCQVCTGFASFDSHLYSIVAALSTSFWRSWALRSPQWPSFHHWVSDSTWYTEMSQKPHDIIGGNFLILFRDSLKQAHRVGREE
jgi:hypothetical protein